MNQSDNSELRRRRGGDLDGTGDDATVGARPITPESSNADSGSVETPKAANRTRHRSALLDGVSTGSTDSSSESAASETKGREGENDDGGSSKSRTRFGSVAERIKSPLMGTLKLEEIRDSIQKNVEVKFAPLHIPPHRRLQTAAVALWALLLPICLITFLLILSFEKTWGFMIPYLIWVMFDPAPERGGRPQEWARRLFLWKYYAQYYPCSIVKEADISPAKPILFGYHPHGIIGMGAFATFATEGTGFSEHFPGISPHLLTLESNFKMPFYRELLMAHGMASVSKKSCAKILSKGPGTAIAIVIGGAAESLSAHPGTADLTLKKRFGFIKMAIREGADLVPVFSFGENDIYDQLANKPGSLLYKIQKRFQKIFGFTLPLFYGRGIFNYNIGLMPFRHPIVSVFGRPIPVTKDPKPSDEKVQELHEQYINELMRIWDKYKDVYARHRTKELTLVG